MTSTRQRYTIWPCDCNGVQREVGKVPAGYQCGTCGAHPIAAIPLTELESLASEWEARAQGMAEAAREIHERNVFDLSDYDRRCIVSNESAERTWTRAADDLRSLINGGSE